MSDTAQGPGWWQASDGRWYPPESHPQAVASQPASPAPGSVVGGAPGMAAPAPGSATGGPPGPLPAGGPGPGPAAPYGAPFYGPPPGYADAAWSAWNAYGAYGPPPSDRQRTVGLGVAVLGVAGLVWAIGAIFNAVAVNSTSGFPHDEQIGTWITAIGILLVSLTTIVIGLLCRRS